MSLNNFEDMKIVSCVFSKKPLWVKNINIFRNFMNTWELNKGSLNEQGKIKEIKGEILKNSQNNWRIKQHTKLNDIQETKY